jgi:glycosyltransferase involved in cell wall biosynthesis
MGKRVLSVARWPVGGIRTYMLYNYPFLTAAGYRFTFVGPAGDGFRQLSEELRGWDGAEFVSAELRGKRCLLRPAVRALLKTKRFALVHAQGMTAAVDVVLAGFGLGVPLAATLHDVFRPGEFAGAKGKASLWVLDKLLSRLDLLLAVGEDARANYVRHLPSFAHVPDRLVALPNGIDTGRFTRVTVEPKEGLRAKLGLDPDVRLVGFLGRFMIEKGFLVLVDAVEQLVAAELTSPFHVVAVGSGDYENRSRREVARRQLDRWVSFTGFVPDVAPLLRQFDLVVVPSVSETCPLLPMEAMVAGIPVLGSNCIGLREVLRGSPSVMVPAGDAQSLCRALKEAIANPWTAAARAYAPTAADRFDVRRSALELMGLFDRLTSRPRTAFGFRAASLGIGTSVR